MGLGFHLLLLFVARFQAHFQTIKSLLCTTTIVLFFAFHIPTKWDLEDGCLLCTIVFNLTDTACRSFLGMLSGRLSYKISSFKVPWEHPTCDFFKGFGIVLCLLWKKPAGYSFTPILLSTPAMPVPPSFCTLHHAHGNPNTV